ncbi:alpha/beta fold hydrolase [Parendozoicomonas sp. Alg238-R29]|uniref:alpha/beta hydrolase n=1 Tax=Parendozoicomonas sp. Alg238-R29 TaxID=2993446 RepID=UPI00248EFF6C|nr:alpha/beta fold hydrolase [Parendozoicomonas sp. Alg238-R29]
MVHLRIYALITHPQISYVVFTCLLALTAPVQACKVRSQSEDVFTPQEQLLFEKQQKLLNSTPSILQSRGYIKRFPVSRTDNLITGLTTQLVIPGMILAANNLSLGFFSRQLNQMIPSESLRGLAYPILSYLWDQVLSPSKSLSSALSKAIPPMIDGSLILASGKAHWAGSLSTFMRFITLLYSAQKSLTPELRHEFKKWAVYNRKYFHLEGNNIPKGITILLERKHPVTSFGETRLVISWPEQYAVTHDDELLPQDPHIPAQALTNLVNAARGRGYTSLQLYPTNQQGKLKLFSIATQNERWSDIDEIPLPSINGIWWTTLISDFQSPRHNPPFQIADPLSPVLLNAIANHYAHDTQRQLKPFSLTTNELLVRLQQTKGLSIFGSHKHFNIWATPGESTIIPCKQTALPDISLQATETFGGDIRHLTPFIERPIIPGWGRLPLLTVKLLILAKLQSWSWQKGVYLGETLERRLTFHGVNKKWQRSFIPKHTKRIEVKLHDEKTMIGNLIRSSHPSQKLIIMFHPTRASSDDMANSGYFGLTRAPADSETELELPPEVSIKEPNRLGQHLNDSGYDVFFPEYRGYKNNLVLKNRSEFYSDAVSAFDTIIAEGKKLYNEQAYDHAGYKSVTVIGYSIGTGAASHLANVRSSGIKNVILLAPFRVLSEIITKVTPFPIPFISFIMKFRMDNQAELEHTRVPIHILHGEKDDFIPSAGSQEMATYLEEKFGSGNTVTHHLLPNLGHEKIFKNESLIDSMIKLFQNQE